MSFRNSKTFLTEIDQLVEKQIAEKNFSVAHLADYCGYSRMSLYRDIKKATGCSPSVYLQNKRLSFARKLLEETNYPIYKIAHLSGFRHAGHFSKIFKRKYGYSPTDYNNQHKT